jgi:hypothetical protein
MNKQLRMRPTQWYGEYLDEVMQRTRAHPEEVVYMKARNGAGMAFEARPGTPARCGRLKGTAAMHAAAVPPPERKVS